MSKKRKDTTSHVTLHDFFGRPDRAAAKKPKPSTNTPRKTVRKHDINAPSDIIVIDDSDDEQRQTGTRQQAPVASGSNLQADMAAADRAAIISAKHEDSIVVLDDDDCEVTSTRIPLHNSSLRLQDVSDAKTNDTKKSLHRSSKSFEQSQDIGFGQPVLLIDTEEQELSESMPVLGEVSCPSPQAQRTDQGSSSIDQQVLEATTDEWGTGDDEMDPVHAETTTPDDSEDVPRNQPPAMSDENIDQKCPICDFTLAGMSYMSLQDHVNACIDKAATSSAGVIDSPKAQPLRPFSSLKTPDVTPRKHKATGIHQTSDSQPSGAFSVLMTSHKENEAWKEAAEAEDRNFRPTKANGGRRKAPFYKVMQGMPIAVDAFRYGSIPGVTAYFLTHAHSDHYTNLSANWKSGPIYCSEGTANLIVLMLGVDRKWVHPLPMDIATVIPDTGGVTCTPIEANHCPGSCLFLFEGPQTINAGDSAYKSSYIGSKRTFRYLHCGDFRASPQHVNHAAIKGKHIDHVYLDTTYLDPKHCFPPQSQVITACAELARRLVMGESTGGNGSKQDGKVDSWFTKIEKPKDEDDGKSSGKTLVVVGTYSIGKERIVKAIAKALQTKVYSDARKTAILRCQSDPELDSLLTSDPLDAGIHLLPLGTIASDKLKIYLERWKGHFSKVIGFRPTGWTFSSPSGTDTLPAIQTVISRSQALSFTYANLNPMKNSTSTLQMYGVPYSEHSSFFELTCFAMSLDWGRMIATVNVGSENSRGKMGKWVERWDAERKKRGKGEIVKPRDPDYW